MEKKEVIKSLKEVPAKIITKHGLHITCIDVISFDKDTFVFSDRHGDNTKVTYSSIDIIQSIHKLKSPGGNNSRIHPLDLKYSPGSNSSSEL